MGPTYSELVALFRNYHGSTGLAASYDEMTAGASQRIFLVPPFEVYRHEAEITRILLDSGLEANINTKFAWEHVRDHQDVCCVLLTATAITFTPITVPVSALPYFQNGVRRVYLSATLSAPDAFARTFGRVPEKLVAPTTTAGECERLILIPSMMGDGSSDIEATKAVIKDRKALILVPTYSRSEQWQEIAAPPPKDAVTEHVNAFRDADPASSEKLILAARYDGVDLPGDTCRQMVIDDLPMGSGPLERFQWEALNLSNSLRSTLASRIVQSFGRISRGMSDHGVVFLTGKRLVQWVIVPRNLAALPRFLQKQIQLGYQISETLSSVGDVSAATTACLERDESWLETYANFMKDAEAEDGGGDPDKLATLALSEAMFSEALWRRDFAEAAKALTKTLETAYEVSANTGAWHSLWLGYAVERAGDLDSARDLYKRAHAVQKNIPTWPFQTEGVSSAHVPQQILEIEKQIDYAPGSACHLPKTLNSDLALLNGSGSVPQTEEALRCLGQYLGFLSTRPEKEVGTGPDVLWRTEDGGALCMEAKTGKEKSSQYKKDDVGQLMDHVQWVKDNTDATTIVPAFVGPLVPASGSANPSPDVLVIELSQFEAIGQRLVSALSDASKDALPITLRSSLLDTLAACRT